MARFVHLGIVVLLGAALAACGVNKGVHQKALDDLAATQNQLRSTESESLARQKRLKELEGELASSQAERDRRTAELLAEMEATREQLLEVQKQQARAQERLNAFRKLNQRFRALVDTGKLKVKFRNGQMVLELPSGVLFSSGQAELSSQGKTALSEVLNILMEFKDRRFLIAGHTDNVMIRKRQFKNNWYLSTGRAVSVVEFMIQAGFDAKNLAAAGYGEFDPVAPNDTEENRQLNRRIEIILIPDLSELPNLADEPS
jgi:chemotaxis protein MotB